MIASKWISEAEKAGWRVRSANGSVLHLKCSCQGCPGEIKLPLANLGDLPGPCDLPHKGQYSRQTFDRYVAIVDELRRRRRLLGLSQEDLTDATGLIHGHINKLESHSRTAQFPTLQLWAETLGVRITLTPVPLPPATARAIEYRTARPYDEGKARYKHDRPQGDLFHDPEA